MCPILTIHFEHHLKGNHIIRCHTNEGEEKALWEERTLNTEEGHAWGTVHGFMYNWGNGWEETSNTHCKSSHNFSHGAQWTFCVWAVGWEKCGVWRKLCASEFLSECRPATGAQPAKDPQDQGYSKAFLLGLKQVLTVCVENLHHCYLPSDIYGLKTPPLERLLLLR